MQGHSFKNYTLSKPYDCHVKCFEETCKCQAYQMRKNRCELLDDDRISAPEDFLEEKEYTYYDMNREYVNHQVTNQYCQTVPGFANGKKVDRESFWLLLLRFFLIRLTNAFRLYSFFKSQCRKISRISNQFQKFEFWLIPPKHPFRETISRNDIKKSPSALHFENFKKYIKNTLKIFKKYIF